VGFSRRETYQCDTCGRKTAPVDNDVGDDEDDPGVPVGWLRVTIERVIPNPLYAAVMRDRATAIGTTLTLAQQQGASEAEVEGARAALEAQQALEDVGEAPFMVEATCLVACEDHAPDLVVAMKVELGKGDVP
jgi:hypothetical protein